MPGLSDSYCSSSTRTLPAISCLSSAKSLITFIPLAGGHSSAPLSGILASCLACVYQYERYAKPSQAESISCLSLWIEVLVYKSTAWLRFGQGKWRTRPLQSSTLNDSCSSLCGQTVATLFSLCHCLPPWTTLFGGRLPATWRGGNGWTIFLLPADICISFFDKQKYFYSQAYTQTYPETTNKDRGRCRGMGIAQIVRRLPFVFCLWPEGAAIRPRPPWRCHHRLHWSICHFKWLIHMQVASGAKHIQVF